MSLPPLEEVRSESRPDSPLAIALSLLFEPSDVLFNVLEPELAQRLETLRPTSYSQLVDACLAQINTWDDNLKSQFIAAHPRIGENKNLSKLSAKEQASVATSPQVLARLVHLNKCYEHCYHGLRYITFVNGRTRAAIAEEMENKLGLEHSLSETEPLLEQLQPVRVEEWSAELERAVAAIGEIARSRLLVLDNTD